MMKTTLKKFWQRARDAVTGRFVRIKGALMRPASTIIQQIKRKTPK